MAIITAGSSSCGSRRPFSSARSVSMSSWAVTGSSASSTGPSRSLTPNSPDGSVTWTARWTTSNRVGGEPWVSAGRMAQRYPSAGARNRVDRPPPRDIIGPVKFLRMKPGHGEILLAEGDPRLREDEERLVEEFRRKLDEGMWAAVPVPHLGSGCREAQMVRQYADIPPDSERVIFFPRASGG